MSCGVAEIGHPTTVARLIGRSAFRGIVRINFLRTEIPFGTFKQIGFARLVKPFLSLRCMPGRCGSRVRGCWQKMILLLLIVVARDNTRVDRGDPAIAVLSIATGPRLTTPRSGWSAATSCIGPVLIRMLHRLPSLLRPKPDKSSGA